MKKTIMFSIMSMAAISVKAQGSLPTESWPATCNLSVTSWPCDKNVASWPVNKLPQILKRSTVNWPVC